MSAVLEDDAAQQLPGVEGATRLELMGEWCADKCGATNPDAVMILILKTFLICYIVDYC